MTKTISQCDDDFASAWALKNEGRIRKALLALETALRTSPVALEKRDTANAGPVPFPMTDTTQTVRKTLRK